MPVEVKMVCTCGVRFESDTWSTPCPVCGQINKPFWERDDYERSLACRKKRKTLDNQVNIADNIDSSPTMCQEELGRRFATAFLFFMD